MIFQVIIPSLTTCIMSRELSPKNHLFHVNIYKHVYKHENKFWIKSLFKIPLTFCFHCRSI